MKFGGHTESYTDEHGRYRVRWVPERIVNGVPYDTPILGYRRRTPRTPAAVEGRGAASRSTSRPSTRRLLRRGQRRRSRQREPHQGALSERRADARQGAAARAAVLLRLAARCRTCSASLQRADDPLERFHEKFAVQLNDTHPVDRRRRADAPAGRRARPGLGRRPGTSRARPFAYTNHTLLPEALETLAAAAVRPRCCRATSRSSTRSTRASSTRCACAFPGDEARIARLSLIDEARRALRAHGAPRVRRQPRHQRRRRAALASCSSETVLRDFARAVARAVQQHDQRRHAAPLAGARATRASSTLITERDRRRLDRATSTQLRELEPLADDAGVPRASGAQVKRANKAALAALIDAAHRRRRRSRRRCSTCRCKRIHEYKRQHLNLLHVDRAVSPAQARRRSSRCAPRTFIFGGKAAPGYRAGEADHPADQRASAEVDQPRPATSRDRLKRRVPPGLQRQDRRSASIRPPISPSRSRPPARKPRAPAT